MRRNQAPPARERHFLSSPRTKLVMFFVAFAVTYGAIRVWQIIIESNNIYLETGAALITVLILFSLYVYYMRQYKAYRRRQMELRQAHPYASRDQVDADTAQLRLYLQRVYGSSVNIDSLLATAGGLTMDTINALVKHYTYTNGKCVPLSENCQDIECGGAAANSPHGRPLCLTQHSSVAYARMNNASSPSKSDLVLAHEECSVCLEDYCEGDSVTELPCRHAYHRSCIVQWLLLHNACPMCKQTVLELPVRLPLDEAAAETDRGTSTRPSITPAVPVESESVTASPAQVLPAPPSSQLPPSLAIPAVPRPLPTTTEATAMAMAMQVVDLDVEMGLEVTDCCSGCTSSSGSNSNNNSRGSSFDGLDQLIRPPSYTYTAKPAKSSFAL